MIAKNNVHKKTCDKNLNCKTNIIDLISSNLIKDELRSTILRKALIKKKPKKKKIIYNGKI